MDLSRITKNPHIMGGKACIRNTQVTVAAILGLLASGQQKEDLIRIFPVLTEEDIRVALAYASRWLDGELPASAPVSMPVQVQAQPQIQPEQPSPVLHEGFGLRPHFGRTPLHSIEEDLEDSEEDSSEDPEMLAQEESMELFHPSHTDKPTVVINHHGIFDRRWATELIVWSDVDSIKRIIGNRNINITLRNPGRYASAMPFFSRLITSLKVMLQMQTFHLDTGDLGMRTKDIYYLAHRLWRKYKGRSHRRRKRRVKKSTNLDSHWKKQLPM